MTSLYILDINPLSDVSFVNIFFHSVSCLFGLLMDLFTVKKLFSLVQYHLFIFYFVSLAWGDISKNILLKEMSKSLLPRSLWFQVLHTMQSLSNNSTGLPSTSILPEPSLSFNSTTATTMRKIIRWGWVLSVPNGDQMPYASI